MACTACTRPPRIPGGCDRGPRHVHTLNPDREAGLRSTVCAGIHTAQSETAHARGMLYCCLYRSCLRLAHRHRHILSHRAAPLKAARMHELAGGTVARHRAGVAASARYQNAIDLRQRSAHIVDLAKSSNGCVAGLQAGVW
eukprot:scaffold8765_cov94-Phaeocystis_antarctica.AAC.1